MKIEQIVWKSPTDYNIIVCQEDLTLANLVFVFGAREQISNEEYLENIRKRYPSAQIIGSSTAGEIFDSQVLDGIVTSTAVAFEHTRIENVFLNIYNSYDSYDIGQRLVEKLNKDNLSHVFVISDGLNVNGSELIKGMKASLPDNVFITGGFAGDGTLFQKTVVIADDNVKENIISAVGFYGDRVHIGYGSVGGWDPFGPERLITKSKNNILYELDGKSALDLYKLYLGKYAKDLPSSGLLFPLSIRNKNQKEGLVRSLLKINKEDNGMFFAGDVPEGQYAKLMKANIDRLVNGALEAAEMSVGALDHLPSLAILVSCVGRKVVLNQRVEEEIEAVREVLGQDCIFTGFYSYGEICPSKLTDTNGLKEVKSSEFHNQTMTITTIKEI